MSADELFRADRLREAVQAQTEAVQADPVDPNKRLFLFELLAFAGDLEGARRQIDAISYGDPGRDHAVEQYRLLLDAEQARRRFFNAAAVLPTFLAEPPQHVRLRLQAVSLLAAGQSQEAARCLAGAEAVTPAVAGTLNGRPFASLRDTDAVFGSVLEVLSEKNYAWVPLEQVADVRVRGPQYPRDLIWLPARLALKNAQTGEVFLPVIYPASHTSSDDRIRLGRVTDWTGGDDAPVRGIGARVFQAGDEDVCLWDWRQLSIT